MQRPGSPDHDGYIFTWIGRPEVDLVIEYDPAFAVADHVHRIGRTARAGRPGKAVLFLMPGSEEGYVSLLTASSTLTPQNSETILQKALVTPVELPEATGTSSSQGENAASKAGKQHWKDRAEGLQLHLEQRLLTPVEVTAAPSKPKTSFKSSKDKDTRTFNNKKDSPLLEAARKGFRSHIRAYATHVKDERGFFDMTQMHLGHVAKEFRSARERRAASVPAFRDGPRRRQARRVAQARSPAVARMMKPMCTAAQMRMRLDECARG